MDIEINGVNWTFHSETVGGEPVLAATWVDENNNETDTIWTRDEVAPPLIADEAVEWLDSLKWEVGNAAALDAPGA